MFQSSVFTHCWDSRFSLHQLTGKIPDVSGKVTKRRRCQSSVKSLSFLLREHMQGWPGSRNSVHPSVRPSVCLSHMWIVTNLNGWCTADILMPYKRAITLLFWQQQWLVGDASLPSEICAESDPPLFEKRRLWQFFTYSISTVRDSKKSSIMTKIKSTTGFPTSYRWSVYVTPKSRKGAHKAIFSVFE